MRNQLIITAVFISLTAFLHASKTVEKESQPTELLIESDNVLTIKNGGYSAITIEFYVSEGGKWEYLGNYRIPGGRSISYQIGEYEYCSKYGYKKADSSSDFVSSFYSCSTTIY